MRISDWSSDVCSSDLPVAVAKLFPRQAFVAPHQRLCTPEIDGHVAELVALDDAVHHLADAVLVFVVLSLALGFAHLLHDDLLGGLRGDAAEVDRRQILDDELRSEEHTSELQSLMRNSYAVFCLKKKTK